MSLTVGQVFIERYQIERVLSQAQTGASYRALSVTSNKPVRILERTNASPGDFETFLAEAKRLSRLDCLQLPKVIDAYALPGRGLYLVFEEAAEKDVRTWLAERNLSSSNEDVTLTLAQQACAALAYLHSQDPPLVHAGLSPDGLLIRPNGKLVLADLGSAGLYTPSEVRPVLQGFSPPEQSWQAPLDPQADVYALGATLYCLLSGHFPPDSLQVLAGLEPPPRPVEALNPAVSSRTSAAIEKAMALSWEQRWASIADFRQALDPAGAARLPAVESRPGSPAQTAPSVPPASSQPATRQTSAPGAPRRKFRISGITWVIAAVTLCLAIWCLLALLGPMISQALISMANLNPTWSPPNNILTQTASARKFSTLQKTAAATRTPQVTALPHARAAITPPPAAKAGDTWTSPVDGMLMAYIPPGEFWMGAVPGDDSATPDEKPQHAVTLDGFWIDTTEVTNAMYRLCVQSRACWQPVYPNSYLRVEYYTQEQYSEYPVVYVNWEQAAAYCAWRGGRLPLEAEWEKAARGGQDNQVYIWDGAGPDCARANLSGCGSDTQPVSSYQTNGYGLFNMPGNVWEWVQDWHQYSYASPAARGLDTPVGIPLKVIRGGSWQSPAHLLRSSSRSKLDPLAATYALGFRCVR